jgi:hypothetical protein
LADCYDILIANDNSENCKTPPAAGRYCKKKNNKRNCEPGCYCSGGIINAVGDNDNTNPYGQVTSNCKQKKAWAEEYLKKRGIFYCPDGYTSKSGAKKITDCFDSNGNHYVPNVNGLEIVSGEGDFNFNPRPLGSGQDVDCPAGSYMPESGNDADDCVACTGNTVVNENGNGCQRCPSTKRPNDNHTACVNRVVDSSGLATATQDKPNKNKFELNKKQKSRAAELQEKPIQIPEQLSYQDDESL